MILSIEDHHEIMQNVAAKSSAKCSLIPSVSGGTQADKILLENFQKYLEEGAITI